MNVLVTGGAGFIGSHLVEGLLEVGHSVVVVDNLISGHRSNVPKAATLIVRDVGSPEIEDLFIGTEVVIHLAAVPSVVVSISDPLHNQKNGENLTVSVLNTARRHKVKRVIFASSAAIYGLRSCPNKEVDPPDPLSPYAASKLSSEFYLRAFSACSGLDTVSLRFFNVFGPRQDPKSPYSGVISIFVDKMRKGLAPEIYGDGEQTRDFVYVKNIVQACLLAMTCQEKFSGDVFNVGSTKATSINHLVQTINSALGTSILPSYHPARSGEVKHSLADTKKAKTILGYEPAISFEDGISHTLQAVII